MIEAALRQYLADNLNRVSVVMEYPKNPPKKFVMLQLTDAGRVNYIDAATFFVTVYADTLYNAAELKEQVKDVLFGAITLPWISNSTLGQETAGIDSANHVYKYDLTFNFYYYREEI